MIEEENLVENARRMGEILQPELRRIGQRFPKHIGAVHGKGLVASLHIVKPGGIEPDAPLAARHRPPLRRERAVDVRPGRLRRRVGQDLAAAGDRTKSRCAKASPCWKKRLRGGAGAAMSFARPRRRRCHGTLKSCTVESSSSAAA